MPATAIAHPNFALIKYWGKRDPGKNLPAVGSLSVTLGALRTETTVDFDAGLSADTLVLNGHEKPEEQPRLTACLDVLRALTGERRRARVMSCNDFPTGAGLASSASGYAALVTAAAGALGIAAGDQRLFEAARIGSGSAPRSLFGGIVMLRIEGGHVVCEPLLAASEWPLRVTVAVTTEAAKEVSSRDGMEQSRLTSPFYEAWLNTHPAQLGQALTSVKERDFAGLAEIAEHNCLNMHSVMLTTRPPLMYWSPTTLACMQAIHEMRVGGLPVFYTVDAGPQVKAIHLPEAAAQVDARLAAIPGVVRLISGGLGEGAQLLGGDA